MRVHRPTLSPESFPQNPQTLRMEFESNSSVSSVDFCSTTPSDDSNRLEHLDHSLRARRAMNTTPDCSLITTTTSSPGPSPTFSCSNFSDSQDDKDSKVTFDKCRSSSRKRVHTYWRYEPDGFFNPICSESSSKSTVEYSKYACSVWMSLLLVAVLGFFALYRSPPNWYQSTYGQHEIIPSLHELTDVLSKEFPNQTNRFWVQLRVALEQQHRRSVLSSSDTSDSELIPAVILFVNFSPMDADAGSWFDCFISRFRFLVASVVVRSSPSACPSLTSPFSTENDQDEVLRIKLQLDNQIKAFYSQGFRCFYFPNLDQLPPKSVVLFHGVADGQNSAYKDTVLLFSLNETFDLNSGLTETDKPNSLLRQFENQVQRHLRALWRLTLGDEETDALLSRLTRTVAVFFAPVRDEFLLRSVCHGS